MINRAFWKNKKVLVTGHTGFKGGWLTLVLLNLGANVTGLSLKENQKSFFSMCKIKKK
jgi:CDP-glucose 4,6-dehydratase